jgi:hypothetical protein
MVIKNTNVFHSKALQNLPKFGFWFENKSSGNPALYHGRISISRTIKGFHIFLFMYVDKTNQKWEKYMYQNATKIPMAMEYTQSFHPKAVLNLPKYTFVV